MQTKVSEISVRAGSVIVDGNAVVLPAVHRFNEAVREYTSDRIIFIDSLRTESAHTIQVGIIVAVRIVLKHLLKVADAFIDVIKTTADAGTAVLVIYLKRKVRFKPAGGAITRSCLAEVSFLAAFFQLDVHGQQRILRTALAADVAAVVFLIKLYSVNGRFRKILRSHAAIS